MERKIGEIFGFGGEWYQCLERTGCFECGFECTKCDRINSVRGECVKSKREDRKEVVFKKLEKVGEPYPNADKLYQLYKLPMNIEKLPPHTEGINLVRFDIVEIEIKQNKEEMEEKKKKLDDLVGLYSSAQMTYKEFDKELKALYTKHSNFEKIGKNLKPFDLQKAKDGKPVCTRDGRKVRILCFDSNGGRPIVALVTECDDEEEIPYKYHCDGSYNCQSIPSDNDLMMLPEKKEGWVNVYKDGFRKYCSTIYEDKEQAMNSREKDCIDTVKINWSE